MITSQVREGAKKMMEKGDRVVIDGLAVAKKYNGSQGTIVAVPSSASSLPTDVRYGIEIDGFGVTMKIKSSNLTKVASTKKARAFELGNEVCLKHLNAKKYNGLNGFIVALPDPLNEGRYGVKLRKTGESIRVRPFNIALISATRQLKPSTENLKSQRDTMESLIHGTKEDHLGADQMALMRMMMTTCLSKEQQIKVFGREIKPLPDYRMELLQNDCLPKEVDKRWANERLRFSFEQDSGLPHMHELVFKSDKYEPSKKDILKRLGTNDRDKLLWYFSPQVQGSIYDNYKAHPYGDFHRHNFSNQAYRKEQLQQGKTHVAVGFVDLGILLAADLAPGQGPLSFYGVERSAFAVAKTFVIWEMLNDTPITSPSSRGTHLLSIIQVWFSSTWTKGTERAVRNSLKKLCLLKNVYEREVEAILMHWLNAPTMSLQRARKEYAASITEARSNTGYLERMDDRIAMAKYQLTGDFGVGDDPYCGSIIFYDCPDGTPPPALDEGVFSTIPIDELMTLSLAQPGKTIISAAQYYFVKRIEKLASWCQNGQVVLKLKCSPFEEIIDEIAKETPWTMSWSNLVDYVDYGAFHEMARRCSQHAKTIHFAYSMNWPTIVWGTSLIDFGGKNSANARSGLIDGMNEANELSFSLLGWNQRIRLPLNQNPINTVGFGLELQHYKKWANFFFEKAEASGPPCNIANVEHAPQSILSSTGSSSVAFTWSYDVTMHFHAHSD